MGDYFSEYSSFAGAKGLPSPADTPYETPFIRSKRSSRVGPASREHSVSPPLPPDTTEIQEKNREGRYSALDPRRFTPTLHANLVSEILNLRRELDSKNNLVENLETSLSHAKTENETISGQLLESAKEVRKAKSQVTQMEKGVYDAVEDLVKERDTAKSTADDLRNKLENAQKKTRQQDEDALRTQSIWENEKDSWDNERRQLERRVHVTESRLRAVVDEMTAQAAQTVHIEDHSDDVTFKDSGLGEGSDTASIRSTSTPVKHRRNMSSVSSFRNRNMRTSVSSRTTAATPDLYSRQGNTLADELGIDEEDEYDDESEHAEEEFDYLDRKRAMESRQNSMTAEPEQKSKSDIIIESPVREIRKVVRDTLIARPQYQDRATTPPPAVEPTSRVVYVDTGYQPSPPPSPPRVEITSEEDGTASTGNTQPDDDILLRQVETSPTLHQPTPGLRTSIIESPISPPQTPVVDEDVTWLNERTSSKVTLEYSTASTQTDFVEPPQAKGHTPKRDSLSPPSFVPSIAIHPPSSRPSSPRPCVLPPGTKNASTQANLGWSSKNASVQTEEIRIDTRPVKLPAHLLPGSLLPSPTFQEPTTRRMQPAPAGTAKILTKFPLSNSNPASPPLQSPTESSPEMPRNFSSRDLRHHPLKALPLPKPVLSPLGQSETFQSNGPLNRSSTYGVSQPKSEIQQLADVDQWSDHSDYEDGFESESEVGDLAGSAPALSRPPPGRFGLSEPPKAVPEDKEISPERRPDTSESYGAAPAPSISSSRPSSQQNGRHLRQRSKPKSDVRKEFRSRSPSFGSMASSSYSAVTSNMPMPPYPIPLRSSSRIISKSHSEGSHSPTPHDVFGPRNSRSGRSTTSRQVSLRKVQSAAVIRNRNGRGSPQKMNGRTSPGGRVSPQKRRRRRRSPDLTPVQSMAFESPAPTKFPIPELPTPLTDGLSFDYVKGSVDISAQSPGGASSAARISEETNLVDAIAGTMVGEWMWKYIRKRKSFGIGEDTSEFPVADQHGVVNVTGHGTRHKRWVWLSPYERTIMWDTKQPTSGPALLGKKGRKLAIQSVLDVEDQTPLPKSPELGSAWKRSILILTPERALKFTATTEERHLLWMTALSFLSQSGQLPTRIPQAPTRAPPPPPIPALPSTSIDGVPIKRHRSPSFGRSTVRDSIRLAKGKRPDFSKVASHDQAYAPDIPGADQNDSADFPAVPRLYISTTKHQRKRSNTSPRLSQPMSNFRSFSSSVVGSSTSYGGGSTIGSSFRPSVSSKGGPRESDAVDRPNFFEAVGTVRMEAFVDPNVRDGVLYVPAPPPALANGANGRRPRRASNLSQSTVDKRRAGYVFDEDGMDPFKGF